MSPDKDYRIVLPAARKVGTTILQGGRNVTVIGGWITVRPSASTDLERRGVYIKGATGTVHLEGLRIDASGGGLLDGIAVNAPSAIVQVENVRVTGLRGSAKGFHADVIQPWGGVRELRVDRLTGSSDYQGLFLRRDLGAIGSISLSRINLTQLPSPVLNGGGNLLWFSTGCQAAPPVTMSEVYVSSEVGRAPGDLVWPHVSDDTPCASVAAGQRVSFPGLGLQGSVTTGVPSGGDFVPESAVGTGYAA